MRRFPICSVLALLLCVCAQAESTAPVRLLFLSEAGGKPLLADSIRYDGEVGETFSVTRLSYLLSGIRLVDGAGGETALAGNVAFVDAVGRRSEAVLPAVPEKKYVALKFRLGLDEATNHSDPVRYAASHPLNPALNRLHWDWQSGYIFLAVEGHWRTKGDADIGGFAYHFAREENALDVELPVELDHRQGSEISIALDVASVLEGISFSRDGATTHSQPGDPILATMKTNLAGAFRLVSASSAVAGTILQPDARPEPIDMPEHPKPYRFTIPRHVPIPPLPLDNPLIVERVELGKKLFNETLLSVNDALSCASCHMSGYGFAETRPISPGVFGRGGRRNSMTLVNLAWKDSFFWDGRVKTLREQALHPIVDKAELGNTLEEVVKRLKATEDYPVLFGKAFGSGAITPENIGLAIENFMLTLVSFDSKFDRSLRGEAKLTDEEARGMELFFTENEPRLGKKGADCFHCHGGVFFTDHGFHNNGQRDQRDPGRMEVTKRESDRGKFATPTLRNVEASFPYMHHGRLRSLREVIDHYDGGFALSPTLDPNLAKHPKGLGLSNSDKDALVAFLRTLTDRAYWEEFPEDRE